MWIQLFRSVRTHGERSRESHNIVVWLTWKHAYGWIRLGSGRDHPVPQRFVPDAEGYVWQEGASDISKHMALNTEPRINVEHALHVLEIIEAARKSQATGERINLQSKFPWPMVK